MTTWAIEHPHRYQAALDGREPAEALTSRDRARLLHTLRRGGMAVGDIARHTRTTPYTVARVLAENGPGQVAA